MSQSIADFRIRSMMCAPLVDSERQRAGRDPDRHARPAAAASRGRPGRAGQRRLAGGDRHRERPAARERRCEQQALQRDLELAHKVQQGLLPSAPPKIAGYQFFDFYEPANQVGGDYYDYVPLPDGRLAVVVADVSGKGVSAALLMAKLSAEVRYLPGQRAQPGAAI